MNIAVIGAGAMGGVWAARLAAAGEEVTVVDVSTEVVGAINADGLVVEGKDGGTETARVYATGDPAEVGPVDAAFFFVKAHHTAGAAALARPLVGPATTVVSLQNGWGNADTLAGVFPPERLALGVTYHSAKVLAPGRVAHTAVGPTFLGPYADGAAGDGAEAIGAAMAAAGIETTVSAGVKTEVWKKLILNCATLPTSSLTRLQTGNLGQPGPLLDLLDAVAAEATAVANAKGYEIDIKERLETIHGLLGRGGAGKASMLQDVEAGHKTEIEVINGAIVRAAVETGIDAPLNRAMVALIGGLERSWAQGGPV
ncbi:MAG: 2-dehydropantoate 2-reductase [uncultured Thermomicrobiales bacterium]|uniref:2-dehydropantoate 2-reductase n=1 Tax=uncultured Thermomicrobiales bacterium TaxID=1645740 RepID=A0A6J4UGL4_9BACT|nr:MAG: 2-dehydropantoate 2-reductase [uncultured Thermomicrobiales bacterium]